MIVVPPAQFEAEKLLNIRAEKKRKTTNALYLTDRQRVLSAISNPVGGHYSELYNIEVQFELLTETLKQANIQVHRPFLNADAGFDSKRLRLCCEKKEINASVRFNKRNGDTARA